MLSYFEERKCGLRCVDTDVGLADSLKVYYPNNAQCLQYGNTSVPMRTRAAHG